MTKQLWQLVVLVLLIVGAASFHTWRINAAEQRGYDRALTKAAAVESVYVEKVVAAQAKTDTVWLRAKTLIDSVEVYVAAVPESIRVAFPVVDTTLRVCSEAATACAAFREQVVLERATSDSLTRTLRLGAVARSDSIKALSKRPTRLRALLTAVGTGALGYAAGRR